MEKITLPLAALKEFPEIEKLISLSRENVEQVVDHCKSKFSEMAREAFLSLIERNYEAILTAETDLVQLRVLDIAITLYAAASFAKTPADFSIGEQVRYHGVLKRPIGRFTHYMCQTLPDDPVAPRIPMKLVFDTERTLLSGYGIPVAALAFMSSEAVDEALRDFLPFSQATYEVTEKGTSIFNLWRLAEGRRFTSTIITNRKVRKE